MSERAGAARADRVSRPRRARNPMQPAKCIGCGCDDYHACEDGFGEPCAWLRVDYRAGKGVCSQCPRLVEQWDKEHAKK